MGEDYVAGDDPDGAGITYGVKCWPGKKVEGQWPNPQIAAYFRKVMAAYGTGAIMTWQERKLVGLLPFMPVDCGLPQMSFCVCAPAATQTPLERIIPARATPFAELTPKVLWVECLSVNRNLYRKGIGSAMVRFLVDWAREQGWERIEGRAFASPDIDDAYRWIPSIEFWGKLGFSRTKEDSFDCGGPSPEPGFRFAIQLQRN